MRIQVVLPDKLWSEFKAAIPPRQRSAFIALAVESQLKMVRFREAIRKSSGAWSDKNHPELVAKGGVERYLARFRDSYLR